MLKRPINYIFLEGPDLAGKTTFYESIHKASDYKWNIQDRSALSMLIHAKYYGRDTFQAVEQLKAELYNLNNIMIILLPEWNEVARRFNLRGDPIQNITSLKKIYHLFAEAAEELCMMPNVIVMNSVIDEKITNYTVSRLFEYENASTRDIQKNCLNSCSSKKDNERVGLNFTLYDDGTFLDIDDGDLLYEKEVDYYDNILFEIKQKIESELAGINQYDRKETYESRRFLYSSDTCISLAHFLLREESLDCKFFLRSSNVKDTLYFDLNFLKHAASIVYNALNASGRFCKMNFLINSGHIISDNQYDKK